MVEIFGKLVQNKRGELCLKMNISPDNPELYEIPLAEILEDYMERSIFLNVFPLEKRWEEK